MVSFLGMAPTGCVSFSVSFMLSLPLTSKSNKELPLDFLGTVVWLASVFLLSSVCMGFYFPAQLCISGSVGWFWLLSLSIQLNFFVVGSNHILVVASRSCLEIPFLMVRDLPTRHIDDPVCGMAVTIVVYCSSGAFGGCRFSWCYGRTLGWLVLPLYPSWSCCCGGFRCLWSMSFVLIGTPL